MLSSSLEGSTRPNSLRLTAGRNAVPPPTSMTARRTVGHILDYHNQARKPRSNPAKGRCWHQSVSPGTYPSWQRGFASSATRSARTKGATLVLARLGNATASLPLRGQPRRKALRSYPAGQVRRKETHPHHPSAPPPLTRVGFWGVRGGTQAARPHPSPLHLRWRGSWRVQGTERPHHSPIPLPPLLYEKNLPL